MRKLRVVEFAEFEELHIVVLDCDERVVCRAVYDLEQFASDGSGLIRTVRTSSKAAIIALKRYMSAHLDYMALFALGGELA